MEEGELLPPPAKRLRDEKLEKSASRPKEPVAVPLDKVVFLTKAQRERLRRERELQKLKKIDHPAKPATNNSARTRPPPPPGANCTGPLAPTTQSTLRSLDLLRLSPEGSAPAEDFSKLKEQYLGSAGTRKVNQKPSEKLRTTFNFEWSAADDTTDESNPLYRNRQPPQLLFGRGFRAGVDLRYQRKKNNFYDLLVARRCGKEAPSEDQKAELLDEDQQHWSEKPPAQLNPRDYRIMREDFLISCNGIGPIAPPLRSWRESALPLELLRAVELCGYQQPTPIQMQAIPVALGLRDIIGIAETGSGKTAAFVLPMLARIASLPRLNDETAADGPYGLVLAPSRELALQIDAECTKFAKYCTGLRVVGIIGGHSTEGQAFTLRKGCEIIIGTPGRIRDCIERQFTVLSQCCYVILDEADRMIDLNFEEVLNWILQQIPTGTSRVMQMFSATLERAVEQLARKYLHNPVMISIGDPGGGRKEIEQLFEFIPEGRKRTRLEKVILEAAPPVIVFVNLKKIVDSVVKLLHNCGVAAVGLHGGKSQNIREGNLADFRGGEVDVLVATDVAGRGIDVEDVRLVVNYDMPKDIVAYTHRIGRTGRAGKKGRVISFVTEEDSGIFYALRQFLQATHQAIPPELSNHPASKTKPTTLRPSLQQQQPLGEYT